MKLERFSVMRTCIISTVILLLFAVTAALAEEKSACIECHKQVTPGIVSQFQSGKMFSAGYDCSICHGSEHMTNSDFMKAQIPTPDTCATCHEERVKQFRAGKHGLAWISMQAMPMITHQPRSIVGEGFKGCSGCHKIGEKSKEELASFRYGKGSCDSCHTRHAFSVVEARDPKACQTCHMGFDHPQWEMWSTSKHGTIFQIEGNAKRAPVCQTCHMPGTDHAVMTAWGFLALRLPEDDAEWMNDRVEILKALGVLDGEGNPTERFEAVKAAKLARLAKEDFDKEREKMIKACSHCHSSSYAKEQLAAGDTIIRDADKILANSIREIKSLYADGILKKPEGWKYAPDILQFYEAKSSVEQELYLMFMEYRMRAFQGAFHSNPDYMHWYGWAKMKEAAARIKEEAENMRKAAKK